MRLDRRMLVVIAGGIALQAANAQDLGVPMYTGVSMVVTDINGHAAGVACEPFDCKPHQLQINPGTTLLTATYGLANEPYLFFAGAPAAQCLSLPWVLGGIAMDSPTILDVGFVPASGLPNPCGLDTAFSKLEIPVGAPAGAQLMLQSAAWPAALDLPAFTRGVLVTVLLAYN